jgi:glyoxylase-like metal-dependent hydrolase (beta-lactamase superfamily II)
VDDGYELETNLTLVPLPGHTPGQTGLQVDGKQRAIFCGDAIHSPIQALNPELSTAMCVDRDQARRVRRALLEDAVEDGRLMVPAHFRGARCMHVQQTATGFIPRFVPQGDSH